MKTLSIYSSEELKEIQKIELDCLKAIDGVCKKIGINFFLIGGSALGAVRHDGFIPWDDDIDIAMVRSDYEKFLKEAPHLLPSQYHLQTPYTDQQNPYFYSKVRIDGTLFMEYSNRNLNIHQGIYVDVFPYDNVPDEEELNKEQFDNVQNLIRKFTFRQIPDVTTHPVGIKQHLRAMVRRIIHWGYKLTSYESLVKLLDAEFTKYNSSETRAMACLNFPKRKCEYALKEDLFPLVKHQFEDTEFLIPGNWDAYLTNHYGDWRKLPPENMRYGHKPYRFSLHA